MPKKLFPIFCIALNLIVLHSQPLGAQEIVSRYAVIQYDRPELLKQFNSELLLGSLSHMMRSKRSVTWEDEVKNKVDVIVERVVTILDMRPAEIKFKLVLLPTETEVQQIFKTKYNRKVDFIAFYAPKEHIVYVSVNDIRVGVFAHELAHMIIDLFYGIKTVTPITVHEVLAQFVETHLTD